MCVPVIELSIFQVVLIWYRIPTQASLVSSPPMKSLGYEASIPPVGVSIDVSV